MNQERKPLSPLHGIMIFIITIILLIFVAAPLQMYLKMTGLALTELILLVVAVVPALLLKQDLKQVFPFKKPKMKQIFGTLLLWVGGFLTSVLISLTIAYFFPQKMGDLTNYMSDFFSSVPFVLTFLIVAVMPAICEETLHRGFILSTFRGVRSKWLVVLLMGLLFGIFHLDFYRFLSTAVLGALLAYIMLETENLLLPMLFHFVNNSLSSLSSLVQSSAQAQTPNRNTYIVGIASYLVIGTIIPFCFLFGSKLIKAKKPEQSGKKSAAPIAVAVLIAVLLFLSGIAIMVTQYVAGNPLLTVSSNAETPKNVLAALRFPF